MKRTLLIGAGLVVLATLLWGFEVPRPLSGISESMKSMATSTIASHGPCLQKNEYADLPLAEKKAIALNSATATVIDIYIQDRTSDDQVFTFKIDHIRGTYDTVEFRPCGVYVHREFGQDAARSFPPGYHAELWKYDYAGNETKLLATFQIRPDRQTLIYYDDDWRVDPTEHYLALDRGYQQSDGALIVKDLTTLDDLFTLSSSNIARQNPKVVGVVSFVNGGWSQSGRYIWYSFDDPINPAEVVGFVQVDTSNWSYRLFQAPLITMGGDAFNPNTGMTTYSTNVAPWSGDAQLDQLYRDQAKRTGQITSFYIYDLLAKRNYLVATTSDPTFYFRPRWLSDSVLEYTLPSGATTTYTVH